MSSKKQLRINDIQSKKKRKGVRILVLSLLVTCVVGFLIFFFLTLFDSVYPPVGGKQAREKSREKLHVTLYFSDANERFLLPEKRYVPKDVSPELQAHEIVKALIEGSKTGLINTFPDKTELLKIRMEGPETALVSFGHNLVENHPGGSASEMATIYSLTNTLIVNMPEIKKVKILIDGKEQDSIRGHVSIRSAFNFNEELIAPGAKEG